MKFFVVTIVFWSVIFPARSLHADDHNVTVFRFHGQIDSSDGEDFKSPDAKRVRAGDSFYGEFRYQTQTFARVPDEAIPISFFPHEPDFSGIEMFVMTESGPVEFNPKPNWRMTAKMANNVKRVIEPSFEFIDGMSIQQLVDQDEDAEMQLEFWGEPTVFPLDPKIAPPTLPSELDADSWTKLRTMRFREGEVSNPDNRFEFFGHVDGWSQVLGDFNGNKVYDAADIPLFRQNEDQWNKDLNFDGQKNLADLKIWVKDLAKTYFGDANFDGEFNSSDLVSIFRAGEFEDGIPNNSTWRTGDWDLNGDAETGDLVLAFQDGGFERGPVVNVPETNSCVPVALMLLILCQMQHRKSLRKN